MGKTKRHIRWFISVMAFIAISALAALSLGGCSSGGSNTESSEKPALNFLSTSAVEPSDRSVIESGTYRIDATAGHGVLSVNDEGARHIAADGFAGQPYGDTSYQESVEIELKEGDEVRLLSLGDQESPECEAEAYLIEKDS